MGGGAEAARTGGAGRLSGAGGGALASVPSAGTSTTALHLGQRAFFPAAAAFTRKIAEQAGHRH